MANTYDLYVIKSARGFDLLSSTLGITLRLQPPPSSESSTVDSVANTCNCRHTNSNWKKSAANKIISIPWIFEEESWLYQLHALVSNSWQWQDNLAVQLEMKIEWTVQLLWSWLVIVATKFTIFERVRQALLFHVHGTRECVILFHSMSMVRENVQFFSTPCLWRQNV